MLRIWTLHVILSPKSIHNSIYFDGKPPMDVHHLLGIKYSYVGYLLWGKSHQRQEQKTIKKEKTIQCLMNLKNYYNNDYYNNFSLNLKCSLTITFPLSIKYLKKDLYPSNSIFFILIFPSKLLLLNLWKHVSDLNSGQSPRK